VPRFQEPAGLSILWIALAVAVLAEISEQPVHPDERLLGAGGDLVEQTSRIRGQIRGGETRGFAVDRDDRQMMGDDVVKFAGDPGSFARLRADARRSDD